MKKFNLSEIMNNAHKLFRNTNGKYTWSECLTKSWKMAKTKLWMHEQVKAIELEEIKADTRRKEELERYAVKSVLFNAQLEASRIIREAQAKAERMNEEMAAHKEGISVEAYRERLSISMGYGKGNGTYCGD